MAEKSTETRLTLLEDSIPRIERNTEKILKAIEGEGKDAGMKGDIALNRSAIKRIWCAIGFGGSATITFLAGVLLKLLV